jgi:hypothetical protein
MSFSRTRFKSLRYVFNSDTPSQLHAHVARLFVLYEDLRIEMLGIVEKDLGSLDNVDARYRVNYFLRRSIGTWREYAEAVRLLDANPDFSFIKARFDPSGQKNWDRAVKFLRKYETFIKDIRNDIGGHFGSKAAEYAVANFRPDAIGRFEAFGHDSHTIEMRPRFVGEIAATAIHRQLSKTNANDRYKRMFRVIKVGWRHGTRCTQMIALYHLWDRFG